MNVLYIFLTSAFAAGLIFMGGCRKVTPPEAAGTTTDVIPTVYVVNYPLFYFAERLGGGKFNVVFPMKEAGDPAFWEPDAATIAACQKADLILLNGVGFSAWTEKVSLPARKMIDTGARFKTSLIKSDDTVSHSHGMQGAHTHSTLAFTTWLDPELAMQQAEAIAEAFGRIRPTQRTAIAMELDTLKGEWGAWEKKFDGVVAAQRKLPVVASHPVYQYLERAGGLNWRSVHWEPDVEPSAEQWAELAALVKTHPAKQMVWEAEPLASVREKLNREFGITSVVFNPAGNRPSRGDLLDVMRENLAALRLVYSR
jgi:zinc transport system substrate-binding protein